jgi:hypothetical protein
MSAWSSSDMHHFFLLGLSNKPVNKGLKMPFLGQLKSIKYRKMQKATLNFAI